MKTRGTSNDDIKDYVFPFTNSYACYKSTSVSLLYDIFRLNNSLLCGWDVIGCNF